MKKILRSGALARVLVPVALAAPIAVRDHSHSTKVSFSKVGQPLTHFAHQEPYGPYTLSPNNYGGFGSGPSVSTSIVTLTSTIVAHAPTSATPPGFTSLNNGGALTFITALTSSIYVPPHGSTSLINGGALTSLLPGGPGGPSVSISILTVTTTIVGSIPSASTLLNNGGVLTSVSLSAGGEGYVAPKPSTNLPSASLNNGGVLTTLPTGPTTIPGGTSSPGTGTPGTGTPSTGPPGTGSPGIGSGGSGYFGSGSSSGGGGGYDYGGYGSGSSSSSGSDSGSSHSSGTTTDDILDSFCDDDFFNGGDGGLSQLCASRGIPSPSSSASGASRYGGYSGSSGSSYKPSSGASPAPVNPAASGSGDLLSSTTRLVGRLKRRDGSPSSPMSADELKAVCAQAATAVPNFASSWVGELCDVISKVPASTGSIGITTLQPLTEEQIKMILAKVFETALAAQRPTVAKRQGYIGSSPPAPPPHHPSPPPPPAPTQGGGQSGTGIGSESYTPTNPVDAGKLAGGIANEVQNEIKRCVESCS